MQLRWNAAAILAKSEVLIVLSRNFLRAASKVLQTLGRKPKASKNGCSNWRNTCISGKANLPALVQPTLWKMA